MNHGADKNRLAKLVVDTRAEFELALLDKRRYPREQFRRFFAAVKAYVDATAQDEMIHRSVAQCVNGLCEYLEVERKRVPDGILFDADRLASMLFAGYDYSFDGDEPPGF